MCAACIAGWRTRPGSRRGCFAAESPAMISRARERNDHSHQAEKVDERPGCPLDSFGRSLHAGVDTVVSVSVNQGALESNRGAVHRHLEGSDAVKPTGCALVSAGLMIGNRKRFNSVCTSRGADPAMRIRRRRSVGRGTQSQHQHARTGTYRHAHVVHVDGRRAHMHARALTRTGMSGSALASGSRYCPVVRNWT